jgi:hypothetical protein
MIRYALACEHEHLFEAWFRSSGDYDDQAAKGLVECPACFSTAVFKQVMSPAVVGAKRTTSEAPLQDHALMRSVVMETMGKIRRHVEAHFDYVGDAFAREARDIHDGVSEQRGIYGEATPTQVKALVADGIQVAPLPPAPAIKPKAELN